MKTLFLEVKEITENRRRDKTLTIRLTEDLRPVVSQLKRIGNNINQIAVKVNSGAVYSVNFDEVIEMQNKIYEKVFEIANADR